MNTYEELLKELTELTKESLRIDSILVTYINDDGMYITESAIILEQKEKVIENRIKEITEILREENV